MKIRLLIIISTFFVCFSINGQEDQDPLLSKDEVLTTIYWIRDNPLEPWDSVFIKKYSAVLKWIVFTNPEFQFDIKCMTEFLNKYPETKDYPYSQEIPLIYSLGQLAYEIENSKQGDFENSCYYATRLILKYYQNLVSINENNRNALLDKYQNFENNDKLKKYISKKY
ncbi:MAG: hypothetical protein JXB49_04810 [Bacteroidales bacterium]|nr:hypothetical protein [Bacteroidales bacterium]